MRDQKARTITCTLNNIEALNDTVYRVRLTPQEPILFYAGQYLEMVLPNQTPYAFSIASAPHAPEIELHIRHNAKETISNKIIRTLQATQTLQIYEPKGECILKENPEQPLLFIAASTCFAQIKGLLEHAFYQQFSQPLYFYWGVRHPSDFYLQQLPEQWMQQYLNFTFVPVVGEDNHHWQGRRGLVHQAVLHDFTTLKNMRVYACGSPAMIYAVLDDFILHGLDETQFYADALDYAPRT